MNAMVSGMNDLKKRNDVAIELNCVSHVYPDGTTVSCKNRLKIMRGECAVLLGANGSGKTTLLKHVNGLLFPAEGSVRIFGEELNKRSVDAIRRYVGFVFQEPGLQLFAPTVEQDVAFGPLNLDWSEKRVDEAVNDALKRTRIEHLRDRNPHMLSGGEKKRVAIAGVIAMNPEIFVFDEPTEGLDRDSTEAIFDIIRELKREGKTVLFSTHDLNTLPHIVDAVHILKDGAIIRSGSMEEIFSDVKLLEESNVITPRVIQLYHILTKHGLDIPCRHAFQPDKFAEDICRSCGRGYPELPARKRAGVLGVVHVTAPFHPAAKAAGVHVGAGTKKR